MHIIGLKVIKKSNLHPQGWRATSTQWLIGVCACVSWGNALCPFKENTSAISPFVLHCMFTAVCFFWEIQKTAHIHYLPHVRGVLATVKYLYRAKISLCVIVLFPESVNPVTATYICSPARLWGVLSPGIQHREAASYDPWPLFMSGFYLHSWMQLHCSVIKCHLLSRMKTPSYWFISLFWFAAVTVLIQQGHLLNHFPLSLHTFIHTIYHFRFLSIQCYLNGAFLNYILIGGSRPRGISTTWCSALRYFSFLLAFSYLLLLIVALELFRGKTLSRNHIDWMCHWQITSPSCQSDLVLGTESH